MKVEQNITEEIVLGLSWEEYNALFLLKNL